MERECKKIRAKFPSPAMAEEGEDTTGAQEEEEEIGESEDGKEANGAQEEEEKEGREKEEGAQGKHEEEGRGRGREEEEGGGEEEEEEEAGDLIDIFPRARVRKIMRIVSRSTVLFLRHLAEASAAVTLRRKKRIVRLEHLRDAVRNHRPTSDFLLDCLPPPAVETATDRLKERPRVVEKPAPPGNRRIDDFFRCC